MLKVVMKSGVQYPENLRWKEHTETTRIFLIRNRDTQRFLKL